MNTKVRLIIILSFLAVMLFCIEYANAQKRKVKKITTYSNYVDTANGIETLRRPGSSDFLLSYCMVDSFNVDSKLIKSISFNWNEENIGERLFKYDDRGNLIYNELMGVSQNIYYTYDSIAPHGIKTKEVYLGNLLQSRSIYNEKHLEVEEISYRDSSEFMRTINVYDSLSNQKIKTECYFDGKLGRIIEYIHDNKNRVIQEIFYDDGKLSFTFRTEYTGDIKSKLSLVNADEIIPEESWEYDNYGNLIKHIFRYEYSEVYSYKYDNYGNWIEFYGGEPLLRQTRIIEYY